VTKAELASVKEWRSSRSARICLSKQHRPEAHGLLGREAEIEIGVRCLLCWPMSNVEVMFGTFLIV
jgi:hypothetical protein